MIVRAHDVDSLANKRERLHVFGALPRVVAILVAITLHATAGWGQEPSRHWSATVHYAAATGGPFSTIETVTVAIAEVDVVLRAIRRPSWCLELPVAAIPLALALRNPQTDSHAADGSWWITRGSRRATSYGVGFKPLGFRVLRRIPRGAVFVGAGGGLVFFHEPTPAANARRLNYIGSADLGVRIGIRQKLSLSGGYRFNHVSNAYGGAINPGIDSHMLSLGVHVLTDSFTAP